MTFISPNGIQNILPGPPVGRDDNFLFSDPSYSGTITGPRKIKNERDIKRQMLHWRVPNAGWVKMFVNPRQMEIKEAKEIGSTRTKGGYVIQYAGEKLIQISLAGSTGSAGMEGINILRHVYRSEQLAFNRVAAELDRIAPISELLQLGQSLLDRAASSVNAATNGAFDALLNVHGNGLIPYQPFPTLASLAASVELYFQGELYRGYFESFSVTESAESPGLFEYNIGFVAHSRQGVRRNFMPWHRQPTGPIGLNENVDVNPLSFQADPVKVDRRSGSQTTTTEGGEPFTLISVRTQSRINTKRNLQRALDDNGTSINGLNLEDDV
jgi:hypothetical protein